MVAQHDTIYTILNSQLDVLNSLNALEYNRHRAFLPNPLQVLPIETLVNVLPHQSSQSTALIILATLAPAHFRLNHHILSCAFIGFTLAGDGCVDGDKDRLDTKGAGAAEEFDCLGAVGVDVELKEEGMAGRSGGDDTGKGVGGVARDLEDVSKLSHPGGSKLTISKIPSLAAALLHPSSPSGCAKVAMAAGHMMKGALLSSPRILRSILTLETFLKILGRSMTRLISSRFLFTVMRSVAADE